MGGRFAHVSSPALCPCQVAQYEGEIALAAPPEHARAFTVEDPDRPLYLTHVDEQVACDLAGTQLHGDLPVQVLEVEGALQLPLVEPRPSKKSSLTTTPAPPPGARPLRAARRAPTPGMCGARRQRNGPWPETLREPELDRRIDSRTVTNVLERLPEEQHRLREAVLVVADLAQQA
jgi:hypothetical protein